MDLEAWGHIWNQMLGLWSIGWAQHSQALMRPRERKPGTLVLCPIRGTRQGLRKEKVNTMPARLHSRSP